jgi:hypothetical protein
VPACYIQSRSSSQPLICFGKQKEIAQHRTNEYYYREIKGLLIIAIVKIKINKTPNIFLSYLNDRQQQVGLTLFDSEKNVRLVSP